jgi:hypothetical protein
MDVRSSQQHIKMATPQRKKPTWMDDKDWEALQPTLDTARADAAKAAEEKAAREAETKSKCVAWHASKPKWVRQEVVTHPGVRGNEREWEVPPKTGFANVPNRAKCPFCGKD